MASPDVFSKVKIMTKMCCYQQTGEEKKQSV